MNQYAKIITDDKRFERALTIEFIEHGIEMISDIEKSSVALSENNFITVVDLDFCPQNDISELCGISRVIGFSNSYKEDLGSIANECFAFFRRPFLVSDFFSVIMSEENLQSKAQYKIQRKRISGKLNTQVKSILKIDKSKKTAIFANEEIKLTNTEFVILSELCSKRGEVVSREVLSRLIDASDGNIADVYICMIRKKIDNRFGIKVIHTIRGQGYIIK